MPKPQRADALRIEATLAPYALTHNDRIAPVLGPQVHALRASKIPRKNDPL